MKALGPLGRALGGPLLLIGLAWFATITVISSGLVGLISVISLGFLPELIEVPPRFFACRALPLGARKRSGLPHLSPSLPGSISALYPRAGRGYQPYSFLGPVKALSKPVGS